MKFPFEYTTRNARDNIILTAVKELDHLRAIVSPLTPLADALDLYTDEEGMLKLINSLAYHAIDRTAHATHIEYLRENLDEEPIRMPELIAVLNRPIGDVLQVLSRDHS